MSRITIDIRKLEQIEKIFKATPKAARQELSKIINKAARRGRERAASDVRTRYAVTRSGVIKDFGTVTSTPETLRATLHASGKPLSLIKYDAFPTRPTSGAVVTARVLNSSQHKIFKNAFVAKMGNNHTNIFVRTGKNRFPIRGFYGPSVPGMYRSDEVENNMEDAIQKKLNDELDGFLDRILRG
ncbi:phage tail protein [Lysinibacillus boronitolerans]|uniref:phage tail protein n=1 Tax=Lysinibacillus boronitolerans TaxID=309788 RepID=UPI0002ED1920|nr:phage tail protein [Lysinibacillus boronitolerans]